MLILSVILVKNFRLEGGGGHQPVVMINCLKRLKNSEKNLLYKETVNFHGKGVQFDQHTQSLVDQINTCRYVCMYVVISIPAMPFKTG